MSDNILLATSKLVNLYFQIGRRVVGALSLVDRHLRFKEMPL